MRDRAGTGNRANGGGALRLLLVMLVAIAGCQVIDQGARETSQPPRQPESPMPVAQGRRARTAVAEAGGPAIVLSSADARPGGEARIAATLRTGGRKIAGAQNDLIFGDAIAIAALRGKPDCSVNPRIGKGATAFAFLPSGCGGKRCTGVRAIVLSVTDVRPIADGSELYSCRIVVSRSVSPGAHVLGVESVALSTPEGQPVAARGGGATIDVR